jgi:serine/threonine-protein kinase
MTATLMVVLTAHMSMYCPQCGACYEEAARFCPRDGTQLVNDVADRCDDDPYAGQVLLGQFEIQDIIGEGGMGRVYRAHQRGFDRQVAIKILHGDLVTNDEMVRRFNREAKIISRLDHPSIIHVYLFGELPDGNVYLAMEYVDGRSLTDLVRAGPVPVKLAVHITAQILNALVEAHRKGVVHRDLKPDNIMLVERPGEPCVVKVLDFGIAKFLDARTVLTQEGLVFGSARYISPEAAAGEPVDERADLYAVGVILYQMLAGVPPFDDSSAVALLMRHVNEPPPFLLEHAAAREVNPALARIVMQALEKEPGRRQAGAAQMCQALLAACSSDEGGAVAGGSFGGGFVEGEGHGSVEATAPGKVAPLPATTGGGVPGAGKRSTLEAPNPISGMQPRQDPAQEHQSSWQSGPMQATVSRPFAQGQADPPFAAETPVASSNYRPSADAFPAYDDDEIILPRSRSWIWLLLFLVVLAGVGLAAAFLTGDGPSDGEEPVELPASVSASSPQGVVADAASAVDGRAFPSEADSSAAAESASSAGESSPPVVAAESAPRGQSAAASTSPSHSRPAARGSSSQRSSPRRSAAMPPAAQLVLQPRNPLVGQKVAFQISIVPPATLRRPQVVVAQQGGGLSVGYQVERVARGRYVAHHTFRRAGQYRVVFTAQSNRGEIRAFSVINVSPPVAAASEARAPNGLMSSPPAFASTSPERSPTVPAEEEPKPEELEGSEALPTPEKAPPPWNRSLAPPPPWK